MSDFDPYHRWLGIAPGVRPPDHYQLLGIPFLEADPEVISSAADRQMAYVRSFQTGAHAVLSQQLLNELAAARVCLLNPDRKREYDQRLQAARRSPEPSPPGPAAGGTNAGGPQLAVPAGPPVLPAPLGGGLPFVPPLGSPAGPLPPPPAVGLPVGRPVVAPAVVPAAVPTAAPLRVVTHRRTRPNRSPHLLLAMIGVLLAVFAIAVSLWVAFTPTVPPGTLVVHLQPAERADLQLRIDGRRQVLGAGGETRMELSPGVHTVTVTCPAHHDFEQPIDIVSEKTTTLRVHLRPVARITLALPVPRPDDLQILFDGQRQTVPAGPTLAIPCQPGTHVVRVLTAEEEHELSVTVAANQNRLVNLPRRADTRLVGRWLGRVELDPAAIERRLKDSDINAAQRLLAQGLLAGVATGRLDITFQADGKYQAQWQLGPLSTKSAGQWAITEGEGRRLVVELRPDNGPVDRRAIEFLDERTLATDLPGDAAQLGRFLCERQEVEK
ncbi:MAG: hypothetical protein U0935_06805 [Pirellulales bacterium]